MHERGFDWPALVARANAPERSTSRPSLAALAFAGAVLVVVFGLGWLWS
jgi:hypothetical protein